MLTSVLLIVAESGVWSASNLMSLTSTGQPNMYNPSTPTTVSNDTLQMQCYSQEVANHWHANRPTTSILTLSVEPDQYVPPVSQQLCHSVGKISNFLNNLQTSSIFSDLCNIPVLMSTWLCLDVRSCFEEFRYRGVNFLRSRTLPLRWRFSFWCGENASQLFG